MGSVRANRAWYDVLKGLVRPRVANIWCFTLCLLRVDRFGKTSGLEYLIIYWVSVNYDGFGVIREFSALLSILVFLDVPVHLARCAYNYLTDLRYKFESVSCGQHDVLFEVCRVEGAI